MASALDQLRRLGVVNAAIQLPTIQEVQWAEQQLAIAFPPTYRTFLLQFSNVEFGTFELLQVNASLEASYLSMQRALADARHYYHLPESLLPFLADNSDYYCFDLQSEAPDYAVIYWSHNGATSERWLNFLDWVERCWIGEYLERD